MSVRPSVRPSFRPSARARPSGWPSVLSIFVFVFPLQSDAPHQLQCFLFLPWQAKCRILVHPVCRSLGSQPQCQVSCVAEAADEGGGSAVAHTHSLTHVLDQGLGQREGERGERRRERREGGRRTSAPGKPRMNTGMRDAAAKADVKGNDAGRGQAGRRARASTGADPEPGRAMPQDS